MANDVEALIARVPLLAPYCDAAALALVGSRSMLAPHAGQIRPGQPGRIHQSHGLDLLIVDYLSAHWRLDYRKQE